MEFSKAISLSTFILLSPVGILVDSFWISVRLTPQLFRKSMDRAANSLPKREVRVLRISWSSGKSPHLEAAYSILDAASFSSSGHSLYTQNKRSQPVNTPWMQRLPFCFFGQRLPFKSEKPINKQTFLVQWGELFQSRGCNNPQSWQAHPACSAPWSHAQPANNQNKFSYQSKVNEKNLWWISQKNFVLTRRRARSWWPSWRSWSTSERDRLNLTWRWVLRTATRERARVRSGLNFGDLWLLPSKASSFLPMLLSYKHNTTKEPCVDCSFTKWRWWKIDDDCATF